jgi:excisionase family DNA binding protein
MNTTPPAPEPLLTAAEAAKYINRSHRRLDSLVASGAIVATPAQGPHRMQRQYKQSDLDAYLAKRTPQSHIDVEGDALTMRQAAALLRLSLIVIRTGCDKPGLLECRLPGQMVCFSREKLLELYADLQQPLLTATEAAKAIGVHRQTLCAWAHDGVIKSVRTPGGRNRYPPAEVDRVKKAYQQSKNAA